MIYCRCELSDYANTLLLRLESQEPRGGGGWDAARQWKVNQLPPLFPSGPAGFVLEQDELLTVAFWSCFSSVSTSKGKERSVERSPLAGLFRSNNKSFIVATLSHFNIPLFLTTSVFPFHGLSEWPDKPTQMQKNIWSPWQLKSCPSVWQTCCSAV